MYYDSLPEWNEIERKIETYEELDPVERFIHEHTPGGEEDEKTFRKQFQEALYFFGGAPHNTKEAKPEQRTTGTLQNGKAAS
jgi:hypothetical protein